MDVWSFAVNNGVAVACLFVMATWGKQTLDNNTKAINDLREAITGCKFRAKK
jgi:hypothetical protein